METGEFDPASSVSYTDITKAQIQSPAHQALAEQVADNSLVLLKNDNVSRYEQATAAGLGRVELNKVVDPRRPGEHGQPRSLLRRADVAGQRGAGDHYRGPRGEPERDDHVRRRRYVRRPRPAAAVLSAATQAGDPGAPIW